MCQGYDGPKHLLGKAEQFFLAVAGVPRYQIRTKCMLVRVSFGEKYGECEEKIQSVNRAVKQLRQSKAFKQALEYNPNPNPNPSPYPYPYPYPNPNLP